MPRSPSRPRPPRSRSTSGRCLAAPPGARRGSQAVDARDYRYMLGAPGGRARKRGTRTGRRARHAPRVRRPGRLRTTTRDHVGRALAGDARPRSDISKRTINKHRQLVCSVLGLRRPAPGALRRHGATWRPEPPKRREADPGVLDFYEPEEVFALARAAATGRAPRSESARPSRTRKLRERQRADEQDAALYTVAAFTGMRFGRVARAALATHQLRARDS